MTSRGTICCYSCEDQTHLYFHSIGSYSKPNYRKAIYFNLVFNFGFRTLVRIVNLLTFLGVIALDEDTSESQVEGGK